MVVAGIAVVAIIAEAVLVFGYLLRLERIAARNDEPPPARPTAWPRVDIIVPVHNEMPRLEAKLRNLAEIEYPRELLRFLIVDGGSDDGSRDRIRQAIAIDPRLELLALDEGHKIRQLNLALDRVSADWILVTDADARMTSQTLAELVAAGERDPAALVLGSTVVPADTHPVERAYWDVANRMRCIESRCGCASIVTAPCYLFRRGLVRAFPDDVVADDVHTAFRAAAEGGNVRVLDCRVTELRSPRRIIELFRHKLRKADAYLREVVRFLPVVNAMNPVAREIFLWRASQIAVTPVLGAVALAALSVLAFRQPAGASLIALGCLVAAAVFVCARVGGWRSLRDSIAGVVLAGLLNAVLLAALIGYPFSRQTARYVRVGSAPEGAPAAVPRLDQPEEDSP